MNKENKVKKVPKIIFVITLIIVFILIFVLLLLKHYGLIFNKTYTSENFNITTIKSNIDYDNDGIDDYTDILNGARAYVSKKPKYKSKYYDNGYPTDSYGVCTDVIWYALKEAGYNLKNLIDEDIKNNLEAYPNIVTIDPNIDFRRVVNLNIFFQRNTLSLTTDIKDISAFQPGDIVVFQKHIAIISDKRNKNGEPLIIHHGGLKYEEDALRKYKLIGHYRFTLNKAIN